MTSRFGALCAAAVALTTACRLDAFGTSAGGGTGDRQWDATADTNDAGGSESRGDVSSEAPSSGDEGGSDGIEAGGTIDGAEDARSAGPDGSAEAATDTDGRPSASIGAADGAGPSSAAGDAADKSGSCAPSGKSSPHCDKPGGS